MAFKASSGERKLSPNTSAIFVKSSAQLKDCPTDGAPEYAFIGRSNVGKSSLINMLLQHKNLAKTSTTPGKTQLINHFLVNNQWYCVDLPGYGYAKVSKKMREVFKKRIEGYLLNRKSLVCVFLLLDSRLTPQEVDLSFMHWLGTHQVPFVIVLTKIDKISLSVLTKNITKYKEKLLESWTSLPEIFLSSSTKKEGRKALLSYIDALNKDLK